MTIGSVAIGSGPIAGPQGAAPAVSTVASVELLLETASGWVDIGTGRIMRASGSCGRGMELDRYNAGTMNVTLLNDDGTLHPNNNADIKPMRRVRLQETLDGVTYVRFTGYADSWVPHKQGPNTAVLELAATDEFKVLAQKKLAESVWEATIRHQGGYASWYRLSDPVGSVAQDLGPNGYHGTYVGSPAQQSSSIPVREPDGSCGFDGLDDYVSLPNGAGLTGTVWTLEVWLQCPTFDNGETDRAFWTQGSDHIGVNPSDAASLPGRISMALNGTTILGTSSILDLERVHVVVTRNGTEINLYVNGVLETTSAISSDETVSADVKIGWRNATGAGFIGYIDEVVLWDSVLTLDEVTLHYEAGSTPLDGQTSDERILQILEWVASGVGTELQAGDSTFQSTDLGGTALDYLGTIQDSEMGDIFISPMGEVRFLSRQHQMTQTDVEATYTDVADFSELVPDFSDDQVINEARISRLGGVVVESRNEASIAEYLTQGFSREGLLFDSDEESGYQGQYIVNLFGEPYLKFTEVRFPPLRSGTLLADLLGRLLASRVQIEADEPGSVSIDQTSIVEGIQWEVDEAGFWTFSFNLSSTRAVAFWLAGVAGFSEAGVTTRAGY